MKKIKIKFCDFSEPFSPTENDFMTILKRHYDVELSDSPEYLIYSSFGDEHIKYDCIKIFFNGECFTPDFNLCDYAIGFDKLNFGDRYLRWPLYRMFQYKKSFDAFLNHKVIKNNKSDFCSFVVSNGHSMKERKEIFEKLSNYKKVLSGGRYLNNTGAVAKDKIDFISKSKFNICFEKCIYDGYTTEKIVEAFASGTVPIYYGNPSIADEFDSRGFINCHDFQSMDDVVNEVIKIDNDEERYQQMLSHQKFLGPEDNELEKFLLNIFDQDLKEARRRPYNARISFVEKDQRYLKVFHAIINPLRKVKYFLRGRK